MEKEKLLGLLEIVLGTYPQTTSCRGGYDIEDQINKARLEKIVISRKITGNDLAFVRSLIPDMRGGRMLVQAIEAAVLAATKEIA